MAHTPIESPSLNLICGGPSAGKTTLIYQSLKAHYDKQDFIIPPLTFPEGIPYIVNGDRTKKLNDKFMKAIGLPLDIPTTLLVEDRKLSALPVGRLRDAISEHIVKEGLLGKLSVLILDLYDDFHDAKPYEIKKLLQAGRTNMQWAQDLEVPIAGLTYPYKAKGNNRSLRLQDRIAGALHVQASAYWKFIITDKSETGTHWILDCIPPPMGGIPLTYHLKRQDDEDKIGRFMITEPPSADMTVEEICDLYNVEERQAYRIRKSLREEAGLGYSA